MAARERQQQDRAEPLFEVRLEAIERDYDTDMEAEVFSVEFTCDGPMGTLTATVALVADATPTLEIVPRAMSDLHRLFAAMTEQSRAWLIAAL